jgi:hypothetical protein
MSKFSPKETKEKLAEYEVIQSRIEYFQTRCNKEMASHVVAHNEAIKPILEKYEPKIEPLRIRAGEIEKEICGALKANLDADGNPKLLTIDGETHTVSLSKKEGSRVVDVEKFFSFVKVKTAAFWKSLKVNLKDAEPLVGKSEIDKIATKPVTYVAAITKK